jgi:dTDP-4-amino-4,6-dideoxygalactose transaminase
MTKSDISAAKLSDDPSAGPIPFIDLKAQRRRLGARIDDAVMRVVDHGKYIMGPEVRELEGELATFAGASHAVTCSSGTDALLLALMAWGVGPGDAVILPTFTFAATAEVVAFLGATPVFCDVLEDTFNIDPESVVAAVETAKAASLRPKVIIAVDLFGQPADYGKITQIARDHDVKLLADAAQSYGATLDGRRVGSFGDATAISFFPAKPLGCYGDGGAVLTDDASMAEVLDSLRAHGKGTDKYDNQRIGLNGRLDTMQAAVLIQKLSIFEDEIEARQRVADRYNAELGNIVGTPRLMPGATSVWAQYTVTTDRRDDVVKHLGDAGIPTAIYYPLPLHRQAAYRDYPSAGGGTPVSDQLSERVFSLPMHPYLDTATQDRIVEAVRQGL